MILQVAYFSRFGGPNENPSGYLYFKLQALRASAASKPRVNRKKKSPDEIFVNDTELDEVDNLEAVEENEMMSLSVQFDEEVPAQILQSQMLMTNEIEEVFEIIPAEVVQPQENVPLQLDEPINKDSFFIRRNSILKSKSICTFFETTPIMMADGGKLVKEYLNKNLTLLV